MTGTSASEVMNGGGGNDVLAGGAGNDVLIGGAGLDTYLFNLGDGFDLIDDLAQPGEENIVMFGAGITPDALQLRYDGTADQGGLTVQIGTAGDGLHFLGINPDNPATAATIDHFEFADGTTLSLTQSLARGAKVLGTEDDDFELFGTFANDRLFGFNGSDFISGGDGDDTLSGGPGNDELWGGRGADTYIFGLGDGVDRIVDGDEFIPADPDLGEESRLLTNMILFQPGITLDDLTLVTAEDNFTITKLLVGTHGDAIELSNRIDGGGLGFRTVSFADGLTVNLHTLFAAGQIPGDQIIFGGPDPNTLIGGTGNDTLIAGSGNTSMIGGLGNDTLRGGTGTCLFYGGAGNDLLVAGDGNNAFVFSIGSGIDTIHVPTNIPNGNSVVFGGSYSAYSPRLALGSLLIQYGNVGDQIHLDGFDPNDAYRNPGIDTFQFTDRIFTYREFIDLGFDLQGTNGDDDAITGTDVVDRIAGLEGNDELSGGSGNDILTGGRGNDLLVGGGGDDTYVFNVGDGVDTIDDTAAPGEGNLIQFGAGITQRDLTFTRVGTALTIQVGNASDSLTLQHFDPTNVGGSGVVETLSFADGSTASLASLLGPVITEGDDVITLGAGDDAVDAKGGNDLVSTDRGNDTLTGGTGNDTLIGGSGDDTYLYRVGDGSDTIQDSAASREGNTLSFGPGMTPASLTFGLDQTGLLLRVDSSGDAIHLSSFDPANAYGPHAVETFCFADETSLTYSQLIDRGFDLTGTAGDDTIVGTNAIDRMSGFGGNDVLQSGAGDDVLDGAAGADTMSGGAGNDTYLVDDSRDAVVEVTGEGTDTVQSSVSYGLADNVEKLTLIGSATLNGTGNALDNVLTGTTGDNALDGGLGADTLIGGAGDDIYLVENVGDVVTEQVNGGSDTVLSAVNYALGADVENLTLTGLAAINGTGNALDNVLIGNTAANALAGGAGNDTYVIGAGDTIIENANQGIDTVITDMTYTLGANLESLTLTGSAVLNGTGNSLTNVLTGNRAANTLDGKGGVDTLIGGVAMIPIWSIMPATWSSKPPTKAWIPSEAR